MEITILMPCLNEERTVVQCIRKAQLFLKRANLEGEILIADNGSTDNSAALSLKAGARVITVTEKGYGAALRAGIHSAKGRYIIMGDADDSYNFSELEGFIEKLREGYSLVMGNRFSGKIMPGAMPPLHKYLGNPILTTIGKVFFGSPVGDFHCGLRGFEKEAILPLKLESAGMEFASEMVVKSTLHKLRITEVPICLSKDGRDRAPHLKTWSDGWRHLRFLLQMSPRWLLIYPGLMLLMLGLLLQLRLIPGPVKADGITFDIHSLLYAGTCCILGIQLIIFGIIARTLSEKQLNVPRSPTFNFLIEKFSLEKGILLGGSIFSLGAALVLISLHRWYMSGFSNLDPTSMMRISIPSTVLATCGAEIVFASFVLSMIQQKKPL